MLPKNILIAFGLFAVAFCSGSCKKFLETKSDQALATPNTLADLQAILDNPNMYRGIIQPNTATDEYYVIFSHWNNRARPEKFGYIWDANLDNSRDWQFQYQSVFSANTVLFNLDKVLDEGDLVKSIPIRGTALLFRSFFLYQLAQVYSPQFDSSTASTDLGVPLRLTADFNEVSVRPTILETYNQIIMDLQEAATLLPNTSSVKPRPSKAACYALLARVFLQIGDYAKARENADLCLSISNSLIDYNTLDSTAAYPIPIFRDNPESILYSYSDFSLAIQSSRAKITPDLYNSFHPDDLRRPMYFASNGNGTFRFKGNYTGDLTLFTGIATDEVFLIRAESWARAGNTTKAMEDLNALLIKRWKAGAFTPFSAATSLEALELILRERKKELIYRAVRWSDLRRLNKDPRFAITLTRDLNGTIYTLPPNDLRYTHLIPLDIINMTKMPQNPR